MGCILKGGGGLYSRLSVGAIVLAAGRGSRLGGCPKSLIRVADVPVIRRQLIGLSVAGVDQVVVVIGSYAALIRPVIEDFPINIVELSDGTVPSQKLSVSRGVADLYGKFDAIMVVPCDMPLLGSQDFIDLISAYKKRGEGIQMVRPVVSGELGNPVIFDYAIVNREYKSPHPLCRQWWADNPQHCLSWDTDNTRYSTDLDTIDDIRAVEKRLGRSITIPSASEVVNGVS